MEQFSTAKEFDIAEEAKNKNILQDVNSVDNTVIEATNVMTGDKNKSRFLYYQLKIRIADYFQPEFMLELTATPERMDGKNIYEICDYNVP